MSARRGRSGAFIPWWLWFLAGLVAGFWLASQGLTT